jgi:hypothetical protein
MISSVDSEQTPDGFQYPSIRGNKNISSAWVRAFLKIPQLTFSVVRGWRLSPKFWYKIRKPLWPFLLTLGLRFELERLGKDE